MYSPFTLFSEVAYDGYETATSLDRDTFYSLYLRRNIRTKALRRDDVEGKGRGPSPLTGEQQLTLSDYLRPRSTSSTVPAEPQRFYTQPSICLSRGSSPHKNSALCLLSKSSYSNDRMERRTSARGLYTGKQWWRLYTGVLESPPGGGYRRSKDQLDSM